MIALSAWNALDEMSKFRFRVPQQYSTRGWYEDDDTPRDPIVASECRAAWLVSVVTLGISRSALSSVDSGGQEGKTAYHEYCLTLIMR